MSTPLLYVKKNTTPLFHDATGNKKKFELLWGDRVHPTGNIQSARREVKARGMDGWVSSSSVGDDTHSLLEFYFIDVGQGDGVLIRTPDDRHVLIDGGWPRKSQPTGKNAADFVDWKFSRDYLKSSIHLDAMICSHNDQDHYGGLWDLLDVDSDDELAATSVTVENFYHAGLSWWKGASRHLGTATSTSEGPMYVDLLSDRASALAALTPGPGKKLQGEWAQFIKTATLAKTKSGAPTPFTRLTHAIGELPGFAGFKILGPIAFDVEGKTGIRKFSGGTSINTNGNSVLMRVDLGSVRVLLTGDLNTRSQQALLDDYAGQHDEFACDVTKACHHGSGDVSFPFLEAVNAAVTVISSGDSEGHDHPRPNIVGASGLSGFKTLSEDKQRLLTPLVYSTEIARSTDLGRPIQAKLKERSNTKTIPEDELDRLKVTYKSVSAGDRNPTTSTRSLAHTMLVARTVYGLVNVRTDGRKILCATLNEKDDKWNVTTLEGRH